MEEYEKYKIDKLSDYLKFMIMVHLAVLGVVITFYEKFLVNANAELTTECEKFLANASTEITTEFWITVIVLLISFLISTLGYIALINSFFEQPKNHKAIITFARKSSGYVLVAIVYSFFFQAAFT